MDPARPLRGLRSNFPGEPREGGPGEPDARGFRRDAAWLAPAAPAQTPEEAALAERLSAEHEEHQRLAEERDCAGMDLGPLLRELAERHGVDPADPRLPDLLTVDDVMEEWSFDE